MNPANNIAMPDSRSRQRPDPGLVPGGRFHKINSPSTGSQNNP